MAYSNNDRVAYPAEFIEELMEKFPDRKYLHDLANKGSFCLGAELRNLVPRDSGLYQRYDSIIRGAWAAEEAAKKCHFPAIASVVHARYARPDIH